MLLLTASLPAILAALRAALLPYRCRHHLQRLDRVRWVVAGNHEVTGVGQPLCCNVADDDAKARARMQRRRERVID